MEVRSAAVVLDGESPYRRATFYFERRLLSCFPWHIVQAQTSGTLIVSVLRPQRSWMSHSTPSSSKPTPTVNHIALQDSLRMKENAHPMAACGSRVGHHSMRM